MRPSTQHPAPHKLSKIKSQTCRIICRVSLDTAAPDRAAAPASPSKIVQKARRSDVGGNGASASVNALAVLYRLQKLRWDDMEPKYVGGMEVAPGLPWFEDLSVRIVASPQYEARFGICHYFPELAALKHRKVGATGKEPELQQGRSLMLGCSCWDENQAAVAGEERCQGGWPAKRAKDGALQAQAARRWG